MTNKLSRRNLLKGIGAGALGLGAGVSFPSRVLAQTAPSDAAVPAFYRFALGEAEVTIIKDVSFALPPAAFAANVEEAELSAFIEGTNLPLNPDGALSSLVDIMVVRLDDRIVLMDTGFEAPNAALVPSLEALGVAPADVTDVVITHFHPDHVGKATLDGAITFPNAQHHISQTEFDFLFGDAAQAAGADAAAKLQPILDNDQLAAFNDEDEIIPGIQAVAAPGHTLGHTNVLVASGGSQVLNLVDLALNAALSLPNPLWQAGFDADGPLAVESRLAILGRAADEGLLVFGYHFPFPGIGYIARDGEGFRFIPASF